MSHPDMMQVDIDLMRSLLEASISTARSRRNQADEMFVLGQMEALANAVYVMIMCQGMDALELMCQRAANEAQERLAQMNRKATVARPVLALMA